MENTILSLQNKLKIHKAIIYVLSGFLLAMVFFIIFDNKTSQNEEKVVTKTITDTVVVIEEKKVEKIVYKEVKTTDTLYLPTPQDTTALPIESKVYEDSIADIFISGFQPSLDSIHYHIPYREITKTIEVEKPKKFWEDRFIFSAGVYTGYSPIYNNFDVIVGFGVGVRLGK